MFEDLIEKSKEKRKENDYEELKTRKIQANWTLELNDDIMRQEYPEIEITDPCKMWNPGDIESQEKALFVPDTPREVLIKEIAILSRDLEMANDEINIVYDDYAELDEKYNDLEMETRKYIEKLEKEIVWYKEEMYVTNKLIEGYEEALASRVKEIKELKKGEKDG